MFTNSSTPFGFAELIKPSNYEQELVNFVCHRVWAYKDVKDLIASLQQEQPEVEFEKEEFVGVAESPLKTLMTAETQMIKITKSKVVVKIRKK